MSVQSTSVVVPDGRGRSFGGETDSTRVLRRLFLTLFLRGRSSRGLNRKWAPKSISSRLGWSLIFYGVFGLTALTFLRGSVFVLSAFLHAMTFFFVGVFVASSAGEVLFNQLENDILLHRPVTARALLWTKITVLIQVSLWLAGAFNLTGLIVGASMERGSLWYPVGHVISTVMEAMFCTGSVVLLYQLCLRWFGRERLDGLMTTVQVGATVGFILMAQILPRVMPYISDLDGADTGRAVWFLPPAWFAGFDAAISGQGGWDAWGLAGLAIAATGAVLWAAFGRLAGDYNEGLQRLSETSLARPASGKSGRRWSDRLASLFPLSWWLRDPVERASFTLSFAYLLRDRDVKLRLYPAIAPVLIMPVLAVFGFSRGGPGAAMSAMVYTAFGGVFLGQASMTGLTILQFSQQWQASDLFRLAPVAGPVQFCNGARKAIQVFMMIPLVLIVGLMIARNNGEPAQILLLLPGLMTLPVFSWIPCIKGRAVPLSRPAEDARSARRGLGIVFALLLSMVLSWTSTIAFQRGWFIGFLAVELVIVGILYALVRRAANRAVWPSIE